MSTNPSIIFYQGRRCTKVPRQPRATDPPSTSNDSPTTTSSAGGDTPDETTAPKPSTSSHTTSTTVAAKPTTSSDTGLDSESSSNESQDQTSSEATESHSSDLDDSIYSTTSTETSTSTTSQTSTSLSEPVSSTSNDGSHGPPYATIFGALFGVLGFIALIIILFFFFRRRRRQSRRNSTASEPGGWSVQKLLHSGRGSPDSTTSLHRDYRSGMSYLSDPSPTSSTLYKAGTTPSLYYDKASAPTTAQAHGYADESPTQSQMQNPFSDTAEVFPHGLQSSIVPFMMRSSAMDPDNDEPTYNNAYANPNPNAVSTPTRPAESYAPYRDRDSVNSGTSLGSTLVLPGRSSAGSTYQGVLFPKPPDSSTNNGNGLNKNIPSPAYQRVVIHRNPSGMGLYEEEEEDDDDDKSADWRRRPPISASRRSSGTIPIALI
ncbi:hypothetical protein BJX64DRAFT_11832 [Aspergillus heterothallicus]